MDIRSALQPNTKLDRLGASFGGPGRSFSGQFTLFEITVEEQKQTVINALNKAGFKYTSKDISGKIDKLGAQALNKLTDLAKQAAQSTVPIRSGMLRNQNIQTSQPYFRTGSTSSQTRTIYIEGPHNPPYRHSSGSSIEVAIALDTRGLQRSQASQAMPGFKSVSGTTANWIYEAQRQFNNKKSKLLLSRFS